MQQIISKHRFAIAVALATMAAFLSFAIATPAHAQATTSTSTYTVTIDKFIGNTHASAANASSTLFGINSSWNATNIGSGSGSFNLGPSGFNSANPYQAVTAQMSSGANYSLSEATSTNVASSCGTGTSTSPFALAGYTWGDTFAQAASGTPTTTAPALTNIMGNKFIIVWNKVCLMAPMNLAPVNGTATTTAGWTEADWSDVTGIFPPITYRYESSNSSSTNADGSFASPAFQSGTLSSSSISTAGTGNGSWWWHVRAVDAQGNMSPWSAATSVTINNSTSTGTTTPTSTPATTTLKVHILKYLDGQMATASSSSNYQFPMTSTWQSANLNGGATSSGSFVLGNSHGGASNVYGADTAAMESPASYSLSEVTGGSSNVLPVGSACQSGKYVLQGYSSSNTSFADAATQATSSSAPSFTGLTGDKYVIVWNKSCGNGGGNGTTTPPTSGTGSLWIQVFSMGGTGSFTLHGNHGVGSFNVNATSGYGSITLNNLTPGQYNIAQTGFPSGWVRFINTCKHVQVRADQTANCFVVFRMPINQWDRVGTATPESIPQD